VKVDREAVKSRRNLDTVKSGLMESWSDLVDELQRVVMRSWHRLEGLGSSESEIRAHVSRLN
jgi:hypothetical protein